MHKCEHCDRTFNSEEGLIQHNQHKHPKQMPKEKINYKDISKKIRPWIIVLTVLIIVIGVPTYLFMNAEILPPTTSQGHTEAIPSSHILKEPMSIPIQKHMLEHYDGKGRPGIIINYNCKKYSCNANLIPNLEKFTSEFKHVYVAPSPKMSAKIAITSLGKIQTFEVYDEELIRTFIKIS